MKVETESIKKHKEENKKIQELEQEFQRQTW